MIDRDSERLGLMGYFDERDPAVKRIIAHLINVAHQNGVTVSICGEMIPSLANSNCVIFIISLP